MEMSIETATVTRRLRVKCIDRTLLIIGLCLYGPFRSISLVDSDGYSFALALSKFDLGLQAPQPPGCPVYVGLARLVCCLMADTVAALIWLSALRGRPTLPTASCPASSAPAVSDSLSATVFLMDGRAQPRGGWWARSSSAAFWTPWIFSTALCC